MEEEKVPSKPADARIVRAVRKLKSNISHKSNQLEENKIKDKDNKNIDKPLSRIKTRKGTHIMSGKNLNPLNHINSNSNKQQKIPNKISSSKIQLDGSLKAVEKGKDKDKIRVFDYETLKRYKKKQNVAFQKNLLSPENMLKYKEEFVSMIKKDKSIKNMLLKLNLIEEDNYMEYVENNFFNKPHFLFVLEMLIFNEVEQANTLKVFRTKQVMPLKVVKENYFRDEINKELEKKIYQLEYENKVQSLVNNIDNFIDNLKNEKIDL